MLNKSRQSIRKTAANVLKPGLYLFNFDCFRDFYHLEISREMLHSSNKKIFGKVGSHLGKLPLKLSTVGRISPTLLYLYS